MVTGPHSFPRRMRLKGASQFKAVFAARRRRTQGPLLVWLRDNELPYPRLGLSVSRKVGTAPVRNTIKRRLRECFRRLRHEWPAGYDVVVRPLPHAPLSQADYHRLLTELIADVAGAAAGRSRRRPRDDNGAGDAP